MQKIERFIYPIAIAITIAMVTTIQVQETTKQLLDNLKTKEKVNSYDIIIRHLLKDHIKIEDMFGFTKKKPLRFNKEDEMKFNEI